LNSSDGEPVPDAAGFVLAGGRSSRMGRDKALIELAGQPLVSHALAILRGAGLEGAIVGPLARYGAFAPVVEDLRPGRGPLAGVCVGLASTSAQWAVFLTVDMPVLPASLVAVLLRHAQITGMPVTVASVNGFAQTFPVVLDRQVLPTLEFELETGPGGSYSAFEAAASNLGQTLAVLPVELLIQSGQAGHPECLPASRWFLNVNSPVDLRRAEALQCRIA